MWRGNGSPRRDSCLENPMEGGAWWAAVHGVAKSRTRLSNFTFMHWRKWQPTPVFLPGEPQGRRSLVRCRLWGHTESDTTEVTQQQQQQQRLLQLPEFSSSLPTRSLPGLGSVNSVHSGNSEAPSHLTGSGLGIENTETDSGEASALLSFRHGGVVVWLQRGAGGEGVCKRPGAEAGQGSESSSSRITLRQSWSGEVGSSVSSVHSACSWPRS
ncbi:hypothetical protein R6Z07M_003378 [Ovis aries]